MKILIIGGNRYVGKRLTHLFNVNGHEVTLFNRGSINTNHLRVVHGDRRKINDLKKIPDINFDIIYDFACFDAKEAELAVDFFKHKTAHYIFISSQSVYGAGANLTEEAFNPLQFSLG